MPEDVTPIIAEVREVSDEADRLFGQLTSAQLNWKPAPDSWSVAQCLEHLIAMNADFFPAFDAIARGDYRPPFAARIPLLPRLWGPLILKAVQPDARGRVKTRPRFVPSSSDVSGDVVSRFRAHQDDLAARMGRMADVDPRQVAVVSPMTSAVAYSLFDAYRIVVAHERRHLAQAVRVTESAGFPGLHA
jgi:hypothetical protein